MRENIKDTELNEEMMNKVIGGTMVEKKDQKTSDSKKVDTPSIGEGDKDPLGRRPRR